MTTYPPSIENGTFLLTWEELLQHYIVTVRADEHHYTTKIMRFRWWALWESQTALKARCERWAKAELRRLNEAAYQEGAT